MQARIYFHQAKVPKVTDLCLQDLWFCDTCTASGRDQLVRTAKAAQLAAKSTLKPVVSRAEKAKAGPRVKRKSFSAAEPSSGVSAASQRAALAASDTSRHVLVPVRSACSCLAGRAGCGLLLVSSGAAMLWDAHVANRVQTMPLQTQHQVWLQQYLWAMPCIGQTLHQLLYLSLVVFFWSCFITEHEALAVFVCCTFGQAES